MQKAQEKGISIDSEAVQYLADHLQSNTRDIEGKIQEISVMALSKQIHHLSLEFVEGYFQPSTFSSSSSSNSATALTPRHLISVCAKQFNLKTSDLCGPSRKKELVSARHITAYLLLTESKLSLEEVGHLLGGRDHTSVMHARDKVQSDISTNPQIRQVINQIKGSL
jgi:chromosomal replication initiator protein